MKKLLLPMAFAAMTLPVFAANNAYFFSDMSGEFAQMGSVYCISPNGEFAVIYDDEMEQSFLWRSTNPDELQFIRINDAETLTPTQVRAVSNDGTITGAYREGAQWHPFVMKQGGELIPLPLAEWALTLNYASAISDNGDIIGGELGGVATVHSGKGHGQSRPVFWVKGSDGEYELFALNNTELVLPEHQGTFVMGMYSDGTLDNSYIYGLCGAGIASYIPFVYNKGEMKFWHKIDYVEQPWYYKGKEMGRTWVELIDGMIDYEDSELMTGFYGHDSNGNLYGQRAVVTLKNPDAAVEEIDLFGKASLTYKTGYYNVYTGQWTEEDTEETRYYTCGLQGKVLFDNNFKMYTEGTNSTGTNIATATGVNFNGKKMNGVERLSADGRVLGTSYTAQGADGVPHAYAVIVTLDAPLVAGTEIVGADADHGQVILTHGDTLEVVGAENVEVFDLNGRHIASGAVSHPGHGTVIVVADGVSHKVLVK